MTPPRKSADTIELGTFGNRDEAMRAVIRSATAAGRSK
jgi:hypothetical protein